VLESRVNLTMPVKRVLVSAAGGIGLSLLAFLMGKSGDSLWRVFLELPGFFIAAFTPGFGVHGDPRALYALMVTANAVLYGLVVYWCYPIVSPEK